MVSLLLPVLPLFRPRHSSDTNDQYQYAKRRSNPASEVSAQRSHWRWHPERPSLRSSAQTKTLGRATAEF